MSYCFLPELWHRSIINMVWHALNEGRGTILDRHSNFRKICMNFFMVRKHREDQGDDPFHFPAYIRFSSKYKTNTLPKCVFQGLTAFQLLPTTKSASTGRCLPLIGSLIWSQVFFRKFQQHSKTWKCMQP